jgi:hypothetical protein
MAGIDFNDFLTRTKESINLDLRAKEIKKKQNKMKQENLMEEKKEAVLKLVDLGIDAKKAQKIIDTMLSNNQGVSNDVMAEDVVAVVKNDEIKDKRGTRIIGREKKQSTSNPLDIRTVVEQGKKDNKSAYEAIKESGYIISFEDDIFSKEVVS